MSKPFARLRELLTVDRSEMDQAIEVYYQAFEGLPKLLEALDVAVETLNIAQIEALEHPEDVVSAAKKALAKIKKLSEE